MTAPSTISITNLTINVNRSADPFSSLAGILANATFIRADDDGDNTDTTQPSDPQTGNGTNDTSAEAPAQQAPEVRTMAQIKGDIVEFLQPDGRFSSRTWSAIKKKFSPPVATDLLHKCVTELITQGVVQTKRRRADGESLYSTNVGAYVEPAPQAPVEPVQATPASSGAHMTVEELVAFLQDDPRYDSRTHVAVRKHFETKYDAETIQAVIQLARATDAITSRTGRDGYTTYYSAA